jgi:hypothetical protein
MYFLPVFHMGSRGAARENAFALGGKAGRAMEENLKLSPMLMNEETTTR